MVTTFWKNFLSPSPLNGHALTHTSDRELLLYQVRLPIEVLYLGWSNPLQGQVGERPQQHVEPQPVHLRGGQIMTIDLLHLSGWVKKTISALLNSAICKTYPRPLEKWALVIKKVFLRFFKILLNIHQKSLEISKRK